MITSAAATHAVRPNPTEYDRFRNHMGAAWAQLEEAKWESKPGSYTDSADLTDALRTAKIAVYKLEKATDLGYQNSDDSGSYAYSAMEQTQQGIDLLAPFQGVKFQAPAFPDGFVEASMQASELFQLAQDDVIESLHGMHD